MPMTRSWVNERSWSALTRLRTAMTANDARTNASMRSCSSTLTEAKATQARRSSYLQLVEVHHESPVVRAFDAPPRYSDFLDPVAHGNDKVVVEVLAAGLHPRARSQANGAHQTSTGS